MPDNQAETITRWLRAWSDGDENARDSLWPLVYGELRAIAARHLAREASGVTLQPTALVHEAYLRLVDQREVRWSDRNHFFAIAATMMRRILVDHARQRSSAKRGSGMPTLELHEAVAPTDEKSTDLVMLDDALRSLATIDPEKASVVELRFFAGLSAAETAEMLGCSEKTVLRHWTFAKLWLHREMSREVAHGA